MTGPPLDEHPLTLFRAVILKREEKLDAEVAPRNPRQLCAYLLADGPIATWRKAASRLSLVGQHATMSRVVFAARERVTGTGDVQRGRWTGQAVGQIIRYGQDLELLTWRYSLTSSSDGPVISAPPFSTTAKTDQHRRPRIGLIGAGVFARNVIVPSLRRAGVKPAVITDASRLRARDLAAKSGISHVAHSPASLLRGVSGLDALIIACSHSSQSAYATEAARAGVPVYLEKPAAVYPEQLNALAEETARTATSLTVGHNRRHSSFFPYLRAATKGPVHIHIAVEAFPLHHYHWYLAPGEGGRFLGNLTHWLDLAVGLVEDHQPNAIRSRGLPGGGVGVDLLFPNGSLAEIRFHDLGRRLMPGREVVTIRSPERTLNLSDWQSLTLEGRDRRKRVRRLRDRGHLSSYSNWVHRLTTGRLTHDPLETRRMLLSHHLAFQVRELDAVNEEAWCAIPAWDKGLRLGD